MAAPCRSSGTASRVRTPQGTRARRRRAPPRVRRRGRGRETIAPSTIARPAGCSRATASGKTGPDPRASVRRPPSAVIPATGRKVSSSTRKMNARSVSHRRAALSAMVSSTCWRSVGARLIAASTSAVAVCCSRASVSVRLLSWSSLEQAGVLDGDHRLVGEGLDEGDLALGEGAHLPPWQVDRADGHALPEQRHRQHGAHPRRAGNVATAAPPRAPRRGRGGAPPRRPRSRGRRQGRVRGPAERPPRSLGSGDGRRRRARRRRGRRRPPRGRSAPGRCRTGGPRCRRSCPAPAAGRWAPG